MLVTGGYTYKTTGQITTYKRPGGASYGYASKGDKVIVLGESKGYVQIRYPINGGYKLGFVTSKNAAKYIYGEDYADIPDGTYYFYSAVADNKALDVSGGKSNDGTNIQLWDANGTDAQKFTVKKQSDGWYKIETSFGKCVDVANGENKEGANVLQWKWKNAVNQHWKFISAGNGYYYIQSRVGRYLDVSGGASNNGTNVQLWTKNTSNAQKWKLVNVNDGNSEKSGSWQMPMKNMRCTWDSYSNETKSWSERGTSTGTRVYHLGIDVYGDRGIVYAASDGIVKACSTSNNGANGRYIVIEHELNGKTIYSFYAHLSSLNVREGMAVSRGTQIAIAGGSGKGSNNYYGTHLHFAIVDTLWSSGRYWGYATRFSGNSVRYNNVTYYNPLYIINNAKLP